MRQLPAPAFCEVLDRIEKQGIEQGIEQGFKEGESYGIVKGKIQILREVLHYSDEKNCR